MRAVGRSIAVGVGALVAVGAIWYRSGHADARSAAIASAPTAVEPPILPPVVVASPIIVAPADPASARSASLPAATGPVTASSSVPPNEVFARIEALFASEPIDREWAGPTARALADGIRRVELDGLDVSSIECRSSTCKLTMHYGAAATQPRALFEQACIGPTSQWVTLHVGCVVAPVQAARDGSGDGSLFVFRDGRMP